MCLDQTNSLICISISQQTQLMCALQVSNPTVITKRLKSLVGRCLKKKIFKKGKHNEKAKAQESLTHLHFPALTKTSPHLRPGSLVTSPAYRCRGCWERNPILLPRVTWSSALQELFYCLSKLQKCTYLLFPWMRLDKWLGD